MDKPSVTKAQPQFAGENLFSSISCLSLNPALAKESHNPLAASTSGIVVQNVVTAHSQPLSLVILNPFSTSLFENLTDLTKDLS